MKRILLFSLMLALLSPAMATAAEGDILPQIEAILFPYEPGPYSGISLFERAPFDPIPLSPDSFTKALQNSVCPPDDNQPEDTIRYIQSLGLPLFTQDCEYLYYYQNRMTKQQFSYEKEGSPCRITLVHIAYDEERDDQFTFLFLNEGMGDFLIDCIPSFGHIQFLQSPTGHHYLMGHTGTGQYHTVRFYHIESKSIALGFLQEGTMADKMDYHFTVQQDVTEAALSQFETEGLFPITKRSTVRHISRIDGKEKTTLLYTEDITYQVQADGSIALLQTEKTPGPDTDTIRELMQALYWQP